MTTLPYPEGRTYPPVGRCVYCGSDANSGLLQREHIVPFGLNGTLVLPASSCPDCARVTCALETFCLQRMFIDARLHLGLASRSHRRNKKRRPDPKVGLLGKDGEAETWQELATRDHPFALCTLGFSPAGILLGEPPGAEPEVRCHVIPSPRFAGRFAKLPRNAALYYTVSTDHYARMLAKIAHSFAVAEYGHGSFEGFLPDVILGRSDQIFHLVGGAVLEPAPEPDTLHSLSLRTEDGLVIVHLRLFAFMGAPAYRIVVGRRA